PTTHSPPLSLHDALPILASNGIDKPVLNAFRMFAKMRGQRLAVESDSAAPLEDIVRRGVSTKPDVSALASLDGNKLSVLVWHYHDDDVPGPDAEVALELNGLLVSDREVRLEHYRIDAQHSNAFESWKRMGAPQRPTPEQHDALRRSGQLALLETPRSVR